MPSPSWPCAQTSIETFRLSDILSATLSISPASKKRRNRSLYGLSMAFLLSYLLISSVRTKYGQVTTSEIIHLPDSRMFLSTTCELVSVMYG